MSNYVQPDYRTPVTPGVTIQPHQKGDAVGNPLALAWPVAAYSQPNNATNVTGLTGPLGRSNNPAGKQ